MLLYSTVDQMCIYNIDGKTMINIYTYCTL